MSISSNSDDIKGLGFQGIGSTGFGYSGSDIDNPCGPLEPSGIFTYFRTDGTSLYNRPDGTSTYKRP